jgi:hypothetical protein
MIRIERTAFSAKKQAKLLLAGALATSRQMRPMSGSFLRLFSKEEALLFLQTVCAKARRLDETEPFANPAALLLRIESGGIGRHW